MPAERTHIDPAPILLLRTDGAVAVQDCNGTSSAIPEITIEIGRRYADAVTEQLSQRLALNSVYLWTQQISISEESKYLHVAEVRAPFTLPEKWRWIDVGQLGPLNSELSHSICDAHQIVTDCESEFPFARLGWFDNLLDWTSTVMSRQGTNLTGLYKQVNGGRSFLVRLDTSKSSVWFKAPGVASKQEWKVTMHLADAVPEWIPQIAGSHPDWGGWLSEEVGLSLYNNNDIRSFHVAADALAKLQATLSGRTHWLFDIGATDQRLPFIRSKIRSFLEMISALMGVQPKSPPTVLNESDIAFLNDKLEEAISYLASLPVPDSIIHGDITAGSIVVDANRCAFIDWSRAYVGFPPICCELMLNKFAPLIGRDPIWRESLWRTYLDAWPGLRDALADNHFRQPLALVSLMAYVLTKADLSNWHKYLSHPSAGYFRNIARRMLSVAHDVDRAKVGGYARV